MCIATWKIRDQCMTCTLWRVIKRECAEGRLVVTVIESGDGVATGRYYSSTIHHLCLCILQQSCSVTVTATVEVKKYN